MTTSRGSQTKASGKMTREQRSRAMRRVKLKGGPLETLIQRELLRVGLRFQRNCKRLAGSPDIVFPKRGSLCSSMATFGTAGDYPRGSISFQALEGQAQGEQKA